MCPSDRAMPKNLHHQALPFSCEKLLALLWCLALLGLSTTPQTGAGPGQLAWHCSSQKVSWSFQHHPCCSTSEYPWRPGTTFAKPFLHTRQCPLHSGNNEQHIFDLRAQLLQLIISGNGAKQAEKASTGAKRSSLRVQTPGGCDPSACSSCCFTRTSHQSSTPPGPGPLVDTSFLQQRASQLATSGEEAVAGRGAVAEDMKARGVMSTSPGGLCGLSALGLETFPLETCPPLSQPGVRLPGRRREVEWEGDGAAVATEEEVGGTSVALVHHCRATNPHSLTSGVPISWVPVVLGEEEPALTTRPALGDGVDLQGNPEEGFVRKSWVPPSEPHESEPYLSAFTSSSSRLPPWSHPSSPAAALVGRATCMGTCSGAARASLLPLSQPLPPPPGSSPPTPASLTHSPASLRPEHFVCKVLSDATLRGAVNHSTGASPSLRR